MLKSVKCVSLAALGAISLPMYASAGTYQSEINARYSHSNSDFTNSDFYHLSGTYYFNSVDIRQGPWAEAAFLQRASSISLHYTHGDMENFLFDGTVHSNVTNDTYAVSTEFYIPNSILFAGLTVSRGSYQYQRAANLIDDELSDEGSRTTVSGELGITPIDGLKISSFFYERQDLSESWNIGARWVTEVLGSAIALDGRYHYSDFVDMVDVGADFYINQTFSIGLTHSTTLESDRFSATGIRARKFFTENFSIDANYTDQHGDHYSAGATLRF
ncbi:putative porin [Marinimicrobium sp. ABcell2]|uniref:putative porin n=1 Tax=Marinimicrobium sp. ABcell2 TaxID=3069751 RepID=UPI0027AFC0CA|nr:putative porin [Marinimicrobium sp. ABcell2]MDQ2077007.1 hypothetical protein [Marinimicrobium sp. ABcell2]